MTDTYVKICSVEGCGNKHYGNGLCNKHYKAKYHRENAEKINARRANLRKENPQKQRAYIEANKEKIKEYKAEWYKKNFQEVRANQTEHNRSAHGLFIRARNTAKRRELSFSLSKDEFLSIRGLNCYYCNKLKSNATGVGLDRIDNNKGYEIDNVLPCCGSCNITRGDNWTVEETKIMIDAVMAFKGKKAA